MSSSRIGGTLIPPGSYPSNQVGGKVYIPAATYPSKSDPTKGYNVCEVSDGSISCDCMGWTRRNPPGGRTCKHTQDYATFLQMSREDAISEPVMQRAKVIRQVEKGGSLADLLKKLEEDGVK